MEEQEGAPPPNAQALFTLPPTMQQIRKENFSEPPAKRRRGRPSGSKNKPKTAAFLRPHVLEIFDGEDIVEAMTNLARGLGGNVFILTANGPVSSAVLKQPSRSSTAGVTLHGCYEIISMSTSFVGESGGGGISVTMAGMNGEVVGGISTGPLVAAGKVVVVVGELLNPMFHFLGEKELDSWRGEREMRNETKQNEEEDFQMPAMADEALTGDCGGGDNDEWCRSWFGQCEMEVRRCFDLSTAGDSGSGFVIGGCEGLFT